MNVPHSVTAWPLAVNMAWPPTREEDVPECLAVNPAGMGHEFVGRRRALLAWRNLFKLPSFDSVLVESQKPGAVARALVRAASRILSTPR